MKGAKMTKWTRIWLLALLAMFWPATIQAQADNAANLAASNTGGEHRALVKVPAILFPNAARIWLYVDQKGMSFADEHAPILPQTRYLLTTRDMAKLRRSVFYYDPNSPAITGEIVVANGCMPPLFYVFLFEDRRGNPAGKLLAYLEDGFSEIIPANPPSPAMTAIMLDNARIAGIIRRYVSPRQIAAISAIHGC